MKLKLKHKVIAVVIAVGIVLCALVWLLRSVQQTEVTLAVDEGINITPEQITSIKSIGEWEFLSITNEELVDTTRKGFFTDDHLVRIYYGTVRLGIDMHQLDSGWVTTTGDTLQVTLPAIGLLDRNFIDEARTKSFYESGRWSHADREALYKKAYRQMLSHCLTPANLRSARENGEAQFRRVLRSMGFENINIHWKE